VLWMVGFLLITGTPPSGIFWGKFIVLKETLLEGKYWIAVIFLVALAIVFFGMARIFISMTQGISTEESKSDLLYNRSPILRAFAPTLFFVLVISIGIYFPNWLMHTLKDAARGLGGF